MKIIYVTLIALLGVIIITLVVILTVAIIGQRNGDYMMKVERSKEYVQKEETIELNNQSQLNLEFISSSVHIMVTEEPKLRIVQYANGTLNPDRLFTSSTVGETTTVKDGDSSHFWFFNFGFKTSIFEVYIPKSYCKNITITSVSSSINLDSELCGNDIKISSTSGTIRGENPIKSETATIKTVSGGIDLGLINAKKNTVKTTSGSIKLTSLDGNSDIKSISGSVKIETLVGITKIETTSGSIKLDQFHILGDSQFRSVSGSVKLNLSSDSNCELIPKSVSGSIKTSSDSYQFGNYKEHRLNVNTTSGSIQVNQ